MTISDDTKKAMIGVHLAGAEQGDIQEQFMVAVLCYGMTGAEYRVCAYKWFKIWVSNPYIDKANNPKITELANGIEATITSEMSSKEKAEGQELADEWIKMNRK